MKNNKMKTYAVFFLICIGISSKVSAQVTIGSGEKPLSGALLQLKETDEVDGEGKYVEENADKGFVLPRVVLSDKNELLPMFESDLTYTGDKKILEDQKHTGLTVYNISTASGFSKGIYVWDGAQWNPVKGDGVGGQRFFYMPSFNLKYNGINIPQTFNVYDEYKRQFTKVVDEGTNIEEYNTRFFSSNPDITGIPCKEDGGIYSSDEIDFVVIGYDSTVLRDVSLDADHTLHYVVFQQPLPTSFMNIAIVIKNSN
jgi:hypothetical protein